MIILTCDICNAQEHIEPPMDRWYLYPPKFYVSFTDDGEVDKAVCDDCLMEYFNTVDVEES